MSFVHSLIKQYEDINTKISDGESKNFYTYKKIPTAPALDVDSYLASCKEYVSSGHELCFHCKLINGKNYVTFDCLKYYLSDKISATIYKNLLKTKNTSSVIELIHKYHPWTSDNLFTYMD